MQLIRGEVVELHETQRELILLMILDRKRLMRANLRRHSQTAEFRPWPLLAEMVATLTTLRHATRKLIDPHYIDLMARRDGSIIRGGEKNRVKDIDFFR